MVDPRNPRDINIPFPWVDGLPRRTQEELYMDFLALGRGAGGGTRWRTIVIAASNSHAAGRAAADYVCDGTADEIQINEAIDSLQDLGGTRQLGRIVLLEGLYICSAQITIDDLTARSIYIEGMGANGLSASDTVMGTRIRSTSTTDFLIRLGGNSSASGSSVTLENLHLTGASSQETVSARDMTLLMRNCSVTNTGTGGCIIQTSSTGSATNTRIDGCQVRSTGTSGIGIQVDAGAAVSGGNAAVTNCQVATTGGNAVGIKTINSISSLPRYSIIGNRISGTSTSGSGSGILIAGTSTEKNVVSDNYITTYPTGITIAGYNNIVSGNTVFGCGSGILAGEFQFDDSLIVGNLIDSCTGSSGIGISITSASRNSILSNRITGGGVATVTNAIRIGSGSTDTGVFGNDTYGSYSGASVSDAGTNTRQAGSFLAGAGLVPTGGSAGQQLEKNSGTDYDMVWADAHENPAAGADGEALRKQSATDYDYAWEAVHENPVGGTTGQVLAKQSNTDYDYDWETPSTSSGLPTGGTINQVLTKNSSTDYDASWQDPTGGSEGGLTGAFLLMGA